MTLTETLTSILMSIGCLCSIWIIAVIAFCL